MKGPDSNTDDSPAKAPDSDTEHPSADHDPEIPHPHDVLCGRGGQSNNHPGNEWFRRLVRSNRSLYRSCPKHTKLLVAKAIVQAVEQQDPPGRFIKLKEGEEDRWEPIPYSQAVNKTSQALREKDAASRGKAKAQQQQEDAKNLEIAKNAANRVKFDGVETPENLSNLTNATLANAKTNGKRKAKETTSKGKKRKVAETFVKPFWWGRAASIPAVTNGRRTVHQNTNPGTIVTPGMDNSYNSNDGNNGIENRSGTQSTGNYEVKNMGRGTVKQMPAETDMDTAPMPIETPLVSRQSSMFRFLSNTAIFRRGSSMAFSPAENPKAVHESPQQEALDMNVEHMGKATVQLLRLRQQQQQSDQDEMDDLPTSGLIQDNEVPPPPTPRGLKDQMSDWFTAIFPNKSQNNLNPLGDNGDSGAPIPPPPGGNLGRSASSALFGSLVESPSLLLTTLKSGVTSMFMQDDALAAPIRRFPSSFQQQRQQGDLQPPNSGNLGNNAMIGKSAVLGEKATDSLLDDFEETPMEKSLRNVSGNAQPTRGIYF